MRSRAGRSLSVFLALCVLAGGVAPPAYAHSHAGADQPHHHADDRENAIAEHAHHHHGGHHHRHGPPAEENCNTDALEYAGLHWHVSLFGIELTLPPAPGDDSETDPEQPAVLTRLIDASQVATSGGLGGPPLAMLTAGCDQPGDEVCPEFSGPTRHPPAVRVLLCDTARRARSGVHVVGLGVQDRPAV